MSEESGAPICSRCESEQLSRTREEICFQRFAEDRELAWQSTTTHYLCLSCGHTFLITVSAEEPAIACAVG